MERPQRAGAWWPRVSWAALTLLLLLGGATGTWAFVYHLRSRVAKQPVASPPRERGHEEVRSVVDQVRPVRQASPSLPAPQVEKKEAVAERRVRHAKKQPATTDKIDNLPGLPREVIIVPSRVSGDDHVIVVSPPAKLGPLWTPETYKKRGMR